MSAFVKLGDVRQEEFDWGVIGWRCGPQTGAKHLVVMDVVLKPGDGHDFHRHPGQEEMIIVKQGDVTQFLDHAWTRRLRLHRGGHGPCLLQRRRRDRALPDRDLALER